MSLPDNQIHGQNHLVQGQSSQANALNIARYRKAVYSALPFCIELYSVYLLGPIVIEQHGSEHEFGYDAET